MAADSVAGHSVGEFAAAHVAGVWSLADAARLIVARGRLMHALTAPGAMVAIEAAETEVAQTLAGLRHLVDIAAVNGPASVVVSGDEQTCLELAEQWRSLGRRTRRLPVSHAFHSPLMEPMIAEFATELKSVVLNPPRLVVATNLAAATVTWADPEYWTEQIRNAVRFADTVAQLESRGVTGYLEVGPAAVLTPLVLECLSSPHASVISLRRKQDLTEAGGLVNALAQACVAGVPVRWAELFAAGADIGPDLPVYGFDQERFWLDPRPDGTDVTAVGLRPASHPLLGATVPVGDDGALVCTGRLTLGAFPWLADHVLSGAVVVPGAAVLDIVLEAGAQVGCDQIEELLFSAPLILPEDGELFVQVVIGPGEPAAARDVRVFCRSGSADWTRCASGVLVAGAASGGLCDWALAWPPQGGQDVEVAAGYGALADLGYDYGPAFRGCRAAWSTPTEVFAEVALADGLEVGGFGIHPALLDAAFHPLLLDGGSRELRLPFVFRDVRLCAAEASTLRVRLSVSGDDVSVTAADESGQLVFGIDSLRVRPVNRAALAAADTGAEPVCYGLDWVNAAVTSGAGGARWACVGAPVGGLEHYPDLATLLAAVAAGKPAPDLVAVSCQGGGAAVPDRVRELLGGVLGVLRDWIHDERLASSRLVLLTEGAAGPDFADVAGGSVWGLVRSAQAEHPGRFVLADLPDGFDDWPLLASAVAADELQLAVHEGAVLVPRFARRAACQHASTEQPSTEQPQPSLSRRHRAGHRRHRWPGRAGRGPAGPPARGPAAAAGLPPRPGRPGRRRAAGRTRRTRRTGPGGGLRRGRPGLAGSGAGRHPGRPAAGRRGPRGRGAGRRHRRLAVGRAAGRGVAAQGRRRLAPARADPGAAAVDVRAVLLTRRRAGQSGAGQLRRRQHPAGRPGHPSPAARAARGLDRLGPVGRRGKHGRQPERGRHRPGRPARGGRAERRAGPGAVRPRAEPARNRWWWPSAGTTPDSSREPRPVRCPRCCADWCGLRAGRWPVRRRPAAASHW